MAGLLVKSGYETIAVETMEAAKDEVAKLPSGAVIVADTSLRDSSAKELINWQKAEGFTFPVIAIVNNLNGPDLLEVMKGGGAVDVVQRGGIDKQLVETVGKYAKPENIVIQLDNALIPRRSNSFREIGKAIGRVATTNANCIIFGESGMGKDIIKAFNRAGTWRGAAKLLGVSEKTLIQLRKKHHINPEGEIEA